MLDGSDSLAGLSQADADDNNSYKAAANQQQQAYVEETIQSDDKQPKLASAQLSLYLTIKRQHANQIFTCIGNHKSFADYETTTTGSDEIMNSTNASATKSMLSSNNLTRLKSFVKFDVQYEPEIELLKNISLPAQENMPISFYCKAHARPMNNLKYRWFIDKQLIIGANKPELRIEKLTRQMHLRQIGCEVTNEIGTSLKEIKLAVLYPPAYVTHLLPASLQPAMPNEQLNSFLYSNSNTNNNNIKKNSRNQQMASSSSKLISNNQNNRDNNNNNFVLLPSPSKLALARELAIGYEVGQELELRCDFDSNPRLEDVLWYKISTDYDVMQDVTSNEADELIAFGAAHAVFRKPNSGSSHQQALVAQKVQQHDNDDDAGDSHQHKHNNHNHNNNKRHILSTSNLNFMSEQLNIGHQQQENVDNQLEELDYEQMSEEVLIEMEKLKEKDNSTIILLNELAGSSSPSKLTSSLQLRKTEPLSSPILRQTNPLIFEPLKWTLVKQLYQSNINYVTKKISQAKPPTINNQEQFEKQEQSTLIALMKPSISINNLKNSSTNKLYKRETQISSSTYPIKSAQEDAMGRYVCKTKSSQPESIQPTVARSVYLIARKSPRIISVQQQYTTVEQYLEGKIQIECLITINTVLETTIKWSKDGKVSSFPTTSINQNQKKKIMI